MITFNIALKVTSIIVCMRNRNGTLCINDITVVGSENEQERRSNSSYHK